MSARIAKRTWPDIESWKPLPPPPPRRLSAGSAPNSRESPARSAGGDDGWSGTDERGEHRGELGLGLVPFQRGFGSGNDARTGAQHRARSVDLGAPQSDRPFTVAGGIDPSDRRGVATAPGGLELGDEPVGHRCRATTDGRCGVQRTREIERGVLDAGWERAGDLGGEVRQLTEAHN